MGVDYSSTGDKENAVRVEGSTVVLSGITINKASGAAGAGDASNFYGCNAGLLAMGKADVTINRADVNTSAPGANGIFSYGAGTKVTLNDVTTRTTNNSSGGVMVAGGGAMYVNDCDIETKDCIVSGRMAKDNVENLQNIMIYQSMSGDAEVGKSYFTVVDKISALDFSLTNGSALTGTVNNANSGGSVTVNIDETSKRRCNNQVGDHLQRQARRRSDSRASHLALIRRQAHAPQIPIVRSHTATTVSFTVQSVCSSPC